MICCAAGHPGTSLAAAATPGPQGAENAANEAAGDDQLSDIIVTAQKRSQSLQDVPISVTALGEIAMQNPVLAQIVSQSTANNIPVADSVKSIGQK